MTRPLTLGQRILWSSGPQNPLMINFLNEPSISNNIKLNVLKENYWVTVESAWKNRNRNSRDAMIGYLFHKHPKELENYIAFGPNPPQRKKIQNMKKMYRQRNTQILSGICDPQSILGRLPTNVALKIASRLNRPNGSKPVTISNALVNRVTRRRMKSPNKPHSCLPILRRSKRSPPKSPNKSGCFAFLRPRSSKKLPRRKAARAA